MNEFQQRIGVGQPHYGLARCGQTRQRVVIADDGPRRGKPTAIQTDYKDGRVGAQVFVDTVRQTISPGRES